MVFFPFSVSPVSVPNCSQLPLISLIISPVYLHLSVFPCLLSICCCVMSSYVVYSLVVLIFLVFWPLVVLINSLLCLGATTTQIMTEWTNHRWPSRRMDSPHGGLRPADLSSLSWSKEVQGLLSSLQSKTWPLQFGKEWLPPVAKTPPLSFFPMASKPAHRCGFYATELTPAFQKTC